MAAELAWAKQQPQFCNHLLILMQTATPWAPPTPQAELFWQNPKHTTHDSKGPEQFTTM